MAYLPRFLVNPRPWNWKESPVSSESKASPTLKVPRFLVNPRLWMTALPPVSSESKATGLHSDPVGVGGSSNRSA